jgi:hypothetical protein
MKKMLARHFTEWVTARAQRVFYVYGMRRSGNHACVGWLVNALEGAEVPLIESDRINNLNYSQSGQTCFINDVSTMGSRRFIGSLLRERKRIRRARFVIISSEDEDSTYRRQWRIPARSEPILVRRQTLNLMASRYQNLNRRAQEGIGASMQSMRARFFATLSDHIHHPQGLVWQFERWSSDASWRKEFLQKLGLEHDIAPPMVGLGSSFGNRHAQPTADQMNERFLSVEPRAPWIAFVNRVASEFPDVLSPDELAAVRALAE